MSSTRDDLADRDLRQREMFPPAVLNDISAMVIGVGAIGRQVALQLASIGVPRLVLVDPDVVEPVNLGPQGYLLGNVGDAKVTATGGLCMQLNEAVDLKLRQERFSRQMIVPPVVFCCVDSIEDRKFIHQHVQDKSQLWVDGRMAAETLRVLTAHTPDMHKHYLTTLFTAAEAYAGTCTTRSTIYCANVAAGLMVCQFSKWLRRLPIDQDVSLNLLTNDLIVGDQP